MNQELRSAKQKEFAKTIAIRGRHGLVKISMRFGKTLVGLLTIEKDEKVLIVYPSLEIKKRWLDDIKNFGFEGKFKYILSTTQSLKKLVKEGCIFDYIIIDEAHQLSPAQVGYIKKLSNGSILALSGSVRRKTLDKLKAGLGLETLVEYSLEDAIKDKIVKDYKIRIHYVDMDKEDKSYYHNRRFVKCTEAELYEYYTSMIDNADKICKDENTSEEERQRQEEIYEKYIGLRTNFIYNSKSLLNYSKELIKQYKDKKVLIFSLRTSVADSLATISHHSKNREEELLEKFKLSDKGHLSVVGMLNTGVTIKHLNNIVCHTVHSNAETLLQKMGRGLQLSEVDDSVCTIDILVLRKTVQENWIEHALELVNQFKVEYVYKDRSITKIERVKKDNPDKLLYIYTKTNSYCYFSGYNSEGWPLYKYLNSKSDKEYCLSKSSLIKL